MEKLLLLKLAGGTFGILREAIESVRSDLTIYRFPYSKPYVPGVVLVNDHFSSVADLSVCLGYNPTKADTQSILLLAGDNEIVGFVVSGEATEVEIDSEQIFPIDQRVQTKLIGSCFLYNNTLIPLVNLSILHKMVQESGYEPAEQALLPDQLQKKEPEVPIIHHLLCAGQSFAVELAGIKKSFPQPKMVVALNYLPDYVQALFLYEKTVLPLFSLARMIRFSQQKTDNTVLLADCGDQSIGLLVELDKGSTDSQAYRKDLPALVRSKWLNEAILENQEISPLIKLAPLIASLSEVEEVVIESSVYKPETDYESGVRDVEVIEFSISGVKHAALRSEYADQIKLKTITRIPNVSPMVLGVVAHENEILPVLDMASCYGQNSKVTPQWDMVLIKNGDFSAFVVTDKVYGFRTLHPDLQLELPFKQTKQFVYDCYSDETADTVILILNIQSIAVNFQSATSQSIFKPFSSNIQAPTPEPVESVTPPDSPQTVLKKEVEREDVAEVIEEVIEEAIEETIQETIQETVAEQQAPQGEITIEPEPIQIEEESVEESIEGKIEENVSEELTEATFEFAKEQPSPESSLPEATEKPEETETIWEIEDSAAEPEKETIQEAKHKIVQSKVESNEEKRKKTIIKDWVELKKRYKAAEHRRSRKAFRLIASLFLVTVSYHFVPLVQTSFDSVEQRIEEPQRPISLEEYLDQVSPIPQDSGEVAEEEVFQKEISQEDIVSEDVIQEKEPQDDKQKPAPSLTSEKQDIEYVVKKGDYLIKITETYTGKGNDYHKVQKENKIPNADLIYPDQVIKINLKEDQEK